VEPKFHFPHAYYIPKLKVEERKQVYAFLTHMDSVMSLAIPNWRPISIKACFYWKRQYGDKVKISGRSIFLEYKED